MGCTTGILKCVMNTLNVLLGLGGLALIAFATMQLSTAPLVYICYLYIVGGVNFVVALLGCCGICQENVCMTTTYAIFILASLILQVLARFFVTDSEGIKKFAADDVKKTWAKELINAGAMDKIQSTYECCGETGSLDYTAHGRNIPNSCYAEHNGTTELYQKGCIQAAEQKFVELFNYSSTNEWTNLVITIIMFVAALYLVIRFRKKQRRYNY